MQLFNTESRHAIIKLPALDVRFVPEADVTELLLDVNCGTAFIFILPLIRSGPSTTMT